MQLRVVKPSSVRFSGLHSGYIEGVSVQCQVDYDAQLCVSAQDWIAVVPAGSTDLRQFIAFQRAPVHSEKCFRSASLDADSQNIGSKCASHPVVFESQTAPIPARHFYQLIFVSESQKAIVGQSCLFYVEPNSNLPPTLRASSEKAGTMLDTVVTDDSFHQAPTMGTCLLRTLLCGAPLFPSGRRETSVTPAKSFYEAPPPPYTEASEEDVFQTQPTSVHNESTYDCIKRYISEALQQPSVDCDRSVSMYEMGHTSNMKSAEEETHKHSPYEKLMCQLSMSNSALLRENEGFRARFQYLQTLLQDHIDHLHNIYYTLYLNGYSVLKFPDGECVNLSQFRGIELGLVERDIPPTTKPLFGSVPEDFSKEVPPALLRVRSCSSDRQNDSTAYCQTEAEKEELRLAMLKCITKSKYNDVDDYVQWLKDCSLSTAKSPSLRQEVWDELAEADEVERDPSPKADDLGTMFKYGDSVTTAAEHPNCSKLPSGRDCDSAARKDSESRGSVDSGSTVDEVGRPTMRTSPKQKFARHRAMSVGSSRLNGYMSARQSSTTKAAAPRRSFANLRSNTVAKSSPRRNLI